MGADDTSAAESYARGLGFRADGNMRDAAAAFLMAFALAPDIAAHRNAAFDVLNVMSGYRTLPPSVITALEKAVQDPARDVQPISLVVRNLLEADARLPQLHAALAGTDLEREAALADAAWLLTHPLLDAVLSRAVNISPAIEAVFTLLRRHLCKRVSRGEDTVLLSRYRSAVLALICQCITNRHAWMETPAETTALVILSKRSDAEAFSVRAAYRPLQDITAADAATLPATIASLWRAEAEEKQRAKTLPELTPVTPGFSTAMQAQYEAFPYPRWRHVSVDTRRTLGDLLKHAMPHTPFSAAFQGEADVLVAGCGTGQPALTLALGLTNVRVTAVDISRDSLAYAARMADDLHADNINFGVADILTLDGLNRHFDFIDCSGVLHHMTNPVAGLESLCRRLKPHGVMMIALYSERGRHGEIAAQRFVKEHGFTETPDGLRAARAALLALPQDHPARAVVNTPDFFTRDGLHDLIFNLHESRTSPSAMKLLLATCGLTAIGVEAPAALGGDAFRLEHRDPATWADLDAWEAFEVRHPQVFAQMIRVWARKAVT